MGLADRTRFILPRKLLSRENYRSRAALLAQPLFGLRAPRNILSLSYAFAHFPNANGRKVVYCHSPLRQIWSGQSEYAAALAPVSRVIFNHSYRTLRWLDRRAAGTADTYVATSTAVAGRVSSYYGLPNPVVIPPPIDTSAFCPPLGPPARDYYVWAGRIVEPYKRVSLLMEAFRRTPNKRLVVAGDGRDAARMRAIAPKNVVFAGVLDTVDLVKLYQGARALIFPSTDDFGMTPLEALACGTPVIAFKDGGALDTMVDESTGVLFELLTPEALIAAISRLDTLQLSSDDLVAHAAAFGADVFIHRLGEVLMGSVHASDQLLPIANSGQNA